jgi:hypothetical protein
MYTITLTFIYMSSVMRYAVQFFYLLCFLTHQYDINDTGFFCGKHSLSEFATVHEGNHSNTVFSRLPPSLYRLLLENEFFAKGTLVLCL